VEEIIKDVATLVTLSLWFSIVGFVAMAAICARIVWLTRDVPARTQALLEGQQHIAELAAEVVRRQRP
jgi:hypothetical protein